MKIILAVLCIFFSINIFANNPQLFADSLQILNFNEIDFSNLIFRENFHLFSPNANFYFNKNGFSIIPFKTQNIQILQDFSPHYQVDISGNFIKFSKSNYAHNIPVTKTFLGLGDEEMNHAFVKFLKGNVFSLENSGIEVSYLAQSGMWFDKDETSKNLDLHLFYHFNLGDLHFYNSTFNQNIPNVKLLENTITNTIKLNDVGTLLMPETIRAFLERKSGGSPAQYRLL